jgi:hypothetical protein
MFENPLYRRATATLDILLPPLGEHTISVDVRITWILCITPTLNEAVLKSFRIRLRISGFPVCDMSFPNQI